MPSQTLFNAHMKTLPPPREPCLLTWEAARYWFLKHNKPWGEAAQLGIRRIWSPVSISQIVIPTFKLLSLQTTNASLPSLILNCISFFFFFFLYHSFYIRVIVWVCSLTCGSGLRRCVGDWQVADSFVKETKLVGEFCILAAWLLKSTNVVRAGNEAWGVANGGIWGWRQNGYSDAWISSRLNCWRFKHKLSDL